MVYDWATKLVCKNKQTNRSAQRRQVAKWQNDEQEEEATTQLSTKQKKNEQHIGRFKLFLHRGNKTLHEFSCTFGTVVNLHTMCEGLVGF